MPHNKKIIFLIFSILFLMVSAISQAADLTLEKNLQKNFNKSRVLLVKIEKSLVSGESYLNSLTELKELGELIRTDHQALLLQLKTRSVQLESLGANAVSRHTAVQERYEQSLSHYLFSLNALSESQITLVDILQLKDILEEILPKKKHRIHGSMPYRHLNLPARTPKYSPEIVPAYNGGNQTFSGADLAASPEAPISLPIAELAESLNWNPVEMYEWVKNNIKTEWYWGAMKGAEDTLRQMSGNDADQATLLVALFRSAGFPARYVRGVIEFFPDIETTRMQTGLDNPSEIAQLFQKAGIPYEAVIEGGRINNFRIEHVWVEVEIPYDNYRGAIIDEHGKTWLALDTSIKVAGYTVNAPGDTLGTLDLSGIRESYLADLKTETPLEYLANSVNNQLAESNPGTTYEDLLLTRSINSEHMKIIPVGLQFEQIAVTAEYVRLPDDLLHKARFKAIKIDETVIFDQTLPLYMLSNRSIAVTFEPETIEDQEIMNAYGGLDNTPSYLIHLRPVLTVDGKREILGQGGLAAGADFSLTVELVSPAATERAENILSAGYPTIIGISAGQAVEPNAVPLEEKNGERLLFEQAISYIDQGNKAENKLASLFQMSVARPFPTLVTLGGVLEVVYLLDSPHGFDWKGLYLDADLRVVEPMGGVFPSNTAPKSLFMQFSSLQGSFLEHSIFENGFGVDSVSTIKLLALASEGGIPVTVIDAANIDTVLPALNLPESIGDDITNAIHQGFVITIPEEELLYEDWSGFAWIKENPTTFESGWMLSGEIAGGMTAWGFDRWPEYYKNRLSNPYLDPPNDDPVSGYSIQKITATDMQEAEVGTLLNKTLQVIVRDIENNPVEGASVTFSVKAGGGSFSNSSDTITVTSDIKGIAEVTYTLGKCTGTCSDSNGTPLPQGNPTYFFLDLSDTYQTQIGENIINASLDSGVSITTPFTHYALPGNPVKLAIQPGGNSSGYVLTWIGLAGVRVMDQYGNPVANESVDFNVADPVERNACPDNPNKDLRPALLIENDAPCMNTSPLYDQCGAGSVSGVQSHTFGEASVQVILGGMPDADYVITAHATSVGASADMVVNTYQFGSCNGYSYPWGRIIINTPYMVDGDGNVINAVKVGSTLPMQAKVYWVVENEELVSLSTICDNGTFQCDETVVGNRDYSIITEFDSESVTFDEQQAVSSGIEQDKIFTVMYAVGDVPAKKSVTIHADTEKQMRVNQDVCTPNCRVEYEAVNFYDDVMVDVYAVDITTDLEVVVPQNEDGYAIGNVKIPFEILPSEYKSGSTTVVLTKDGIPIQYIPAELQGQGFAEIAPGFQFDKDSNYKAQVILNIESEYIEIKSKEISLVPLTIELDADLNRDGIFNEDDPDEYITPGLIIPLNSDDDDNDGIADLEDDVLAELDANNNLSPVKDDDLVKVELKALPTTLSEGTVILEVISNSPQVKIWKNQEKGADNLLIDTSISNKKEYILGSSDFSTIAALPDSIYVEGIKESDPASNHVFLISKYITTDGQEVEADRIYITVFRAEIIPDYDRNGMIDDEDRNKVTEDKPWRFWINDDSDVGADSDGIGSSGDDLPGQNKDNSNNLVNTIRDMIDFFPLYLDLGKALSIWPPSKGYKYALKDETALTPGDVKLGVFEGMNGSETLTSDKVYDYLEDLAMSKELSTKEVHAVDAVGVELSEAFLDKISSSDKNGIILVEGRKATISPLTLEISKDGQIAHSIAFPLEIVPVEEMFGHKNLRKEAGPADGDPDRYTSIDSLTQKTYVGENKEIGKQPFGMQGVDKSLVWMHGYNNSPEVARATFSEVFKRFFHAGLTGRFYGVSWFGDPPAPFMNLGLPAHYHQAVVNAFATAGAYRDFIKSIPGTTNIAAHSLGNMVVGSAIHDKSPQGESLTSFAKYFAIDAAVALEAYGQVSDVSTLVNLDGTLTADPSASMVNVSDWPQYIAAGQSRLLASEWYKRFKETADNRKELTWRSRLAQVPSDKVYNFYSTTEEVLRSYNGDDIATIKGIWSNRDSVKDYLATSAFVKQEKFKGRRGFFEILDNFGGVSSSYCGWSFGSDWEKGLIIKQKYTPQEAKDEIGDDQLLMAKPFFALDNRHLFPNPFSLLEPGLDELVSTSGSDFVLKKISETDLKTYYTKNQPAHSLVTVKDWLLAEAFPATTLPLGANRFSFLDFNNIDMSGVSNNNGGCCKTSEHLWPRKRNGISVWYHSDYKDISYQHVFTFYKKIKDLSEN